MGKHYDKIYSWYLALLPIIVILLPKMTALAILLFIPLLVGGLKSKKLIFQLNWLNVSFFLFYLIYLIYCLFTRHPDSASKYLEYKLSFLMFPLIFSFIPKQKPNIKWISLSFIFSALILSILSFLHSYQCYTASGDITCWITISFSYLHHPTYASVFYSVAIFLAWYAWKNHFVKNSLIITILITIVFTLSIFLCLSLAGMIFLGMSFSYLMLLKIYHKWGLKFVIGSFFIVPVLFYTAITFVPQIRGEFENASQQTKLYLKNPTAFVRKQTTSGSDVRLIMWTVSAQAIMKHPLGVGTGNVDDALISELQKIGQNDLSLRLFNPHNQYLQTWLEIGVYGLLILLFICLYTFKNGVKYRNYLLVLVSVSLMFNMLFESMFQRQSGIVFYTFALCFLMAYKDIHFKKIESK